MCPVLRKKLGHFCKVSHPGLRSFPSMWFVTRIDFKYIFQWGVAIFANVQGSRSCVAQPPEVVIVVYSAEVVGSAAQTLQFFSKRCQVSALTQSCWSNIRVEGY